MSNKNTSRIVVVDGSGQVQVISRRVPEPGNGEILVRNHVSLLSPGTEGNKLSSRRREPNPDADDLSLGYQASGIVEAVGPDVTRIGLGERVAVMGDGAVHGDHSLVPQNLCVGLPESVSFEEGAFVNLAATALNAVRRAELQLGELVLVVGLGLVGQLVSELAAVSGVHVLGMDRFNNRLAIAEATGIERTVRPSDSAVHPDIADFMGNYGLDCAFMCFGGEGTEAFRTVLAHMKQSPDGHRMGRIVVVGGVYASLLFDASAGNIDIR